MTDDKLFYNYTIEKHLRELSQFDEDYELLYSIWELNKKNLSRGLNSVSSSYPQYSIHDFTHSSTLLNNIQCVLGEGRIKRLGATDSFLILMSCLTHDIGMILTYNIIEKEWTSPDFIFKLEKLSSSQDSVISKNAQLLLDLNKNVKQKEKTDKDGFKWALEVKNAVVILTAEIFRSNHPQQSADYLTSNEEFKRLAENFHSEQLPRRFMDLLAKIAISHGQDFDSVMDSLYQQANGLKGDYIHPRFIACMLRLGDLLDFDSNRFDQYAQASLKDMPETSEVHKEKHSSVRHMLISPTAIEAELDCPTEEVYRVARSWFDWLEAEVNSQSREWTRITPENLGGLPPVIEKDSIKILYRGIQERPELLNLKFAMSQHKIFQILQGGGIYKEPGFAFIREIVQNAFDASKIQMWNDYTLGLYSGYESSAKEIIFPDDIDSRIYNQYPVELSVKWRDENKDVLHVECRDVGTGISEATLVRMTQFVGESRMKDSGYVEQYRDMPSWLKPTAAFGIGLQSVFFVAPTFDVETNYMGEVPKRIQFRSPSNGQYSFISEKNITRSRGTTVKVDIPRDRFPEIFGSSCDWNILEKVDVMAANGDDIYLAKIDDFVLKTFGAQTNSCFKYQTECEDRSFDVNVEQKTDTKSCVLENYRCYYSDKDGTLVFDISETEFGSSMKIWFNSQYEEHTASHKLYLRGVLVSNASMNYFVASYSSIMWNLYNQTTDMIVDLSRDNLTYKGRKWMNENFPDHVLPNALQVINQVFDQLGESDIKSFEIQYFNFALTAFACRKDQYVNRKFLRMIHIPQFIASKGGTTELLTALDLFEAESIYLVDTYEIMKGASFLQKQKNLEELYSKEFSDKILIWANEYLFGALVFRFTCDSIIMCNQDCKVLRMKKIIGEETYQMVTLDSEKNYLKTLNTSSLLEASRSVIMGLSDYSDLVVKKHFVSGYEHFPHYSNCFIYSPFPKHYDVKKFIEKGRELDSERLYAFIQENIDVFLTPTLIKDIITFNLQEGVTESQIKDCYIRLIEDYLELQKK